MLRSAAELAEVIEVKDTLTPEELDIVDEVTLRSDLRPFRPSELTMELVVVETELIGVLLGAVEVTKGTEVTDTELVGASLPFSLTLAEMKMFDQEVENLAPGQLNDRYLIQFLKGKNGPKLTNIDFKNDQN